VKQRTLSVERGVTRDRDDRNVRGPATRDVIRPQGPKPHLAISAACCVCTLFGFFHHDYQIVNEVTQLSPICISIPLLTHFFPPAL
jgi:hypothetical protein